jgi:cyclase
MVTIVDLSVSVCPDNWEPEPIKRKVINHVKGGDLLGKANIYRGDKNKWFRFRERVKSLLGWGITHRDFPNEKGLSLMQYQLTTHTGTHIDAPYHYGDLNNAGECARTITELPLSWCYADGVVLHLTDNLEKGPVELNEIKKKLEEINYVIKPYDIVLLATNGSAHYGKPEYFTLYRGVSREATEWLVSKGVKIIGVDSFGFDAPFHIMLDNYTKTGDRDHLWPAHMYGREKEYCQLERLTNLESLTRTSGFKVACFPVKLEGADASWCRVVAIIEGEDNDCNETCY